MSDEPTREREVYLYNLTPMTGKDAQKDRRAVHFTIEINRSTRNANLLAFPAALIALGVAIVVIRLLPLIPVWTAVIPAALAYGVVLFANLARQRRGLKLTQWRAFADRKRARTGVFIQCGSVIDPLSSRPLKVVRSGTPNDSDPQWDTDLILDEVTA
ncbi:MAG: hypothetical protein L0G94_14900 [Brachybacterium sp.]|uniref:hypothetical protein n=1 Tax=Brachybacterium sp. TaxID=1891286 RepID=UPI0026488C88|nr:hypothetical protein [Brachybacterium sp.]MDN5687944.1 hypothetical protein [Brachybacterium sp.]